MRGTWCLGILLAGLVCGCVPLVGRQVGREGEQKEFPGVHQLLEESSVDRVSILVVHGFGQHPPGYSAPMQVRLKQELRLDGRCAEPVGIDGGLYGSLTVCDYRTPSSRRVRLYELSWSALTAGLKAKFLQSDVEADGRLWLNRTAKNALLNERFSDAILYLGAFKERMQVPIEYALCFMVLDENPTGPLSADDPHGTCRKAFVETGFREPKRGAFVIITESLGSTMVFETLGAQYRTSNAEPSTDIGRLRRRIAEEFIRQTRIVFMLANQLPLLTLATQTTPLRHDDVASAFPQGFQELLRGHSAPEFSGESPPRIHFVAVSDPNDLLGYSIPAQLVPEDLKARISLTNVVMHIARVGYFFVFAHPIDAHSRYVDNEEVRRMIVCGEPARC